MEDFQDINELYLDHPSQKPFGGVLKEAIKNEDGFINDLEQLLVLLRDPSLDQSALSMNNFIKTISWMLEAHHHLKNELETTPSPSCAFFNFMTSIPLYLDYCCYLKKIRTCLEVSLDKDGELWLNSGHLLESPINHIKRYEQILTGFCKVMPEQEGKAMNGICESIQKTINDMKNICFTTENILKILWIQKCFVGGNLKLFHPGRVLLKEGVLTKIHLRKRGMGERVLFLFNDLLIVAKKRHKCEDLYSRSSLHCCSLVPLNTCSVRSILTSKFEGEPLFKISWGNNVHLMYSPIMGLSQTWMKEMQQAIRECKESTSATSCTKNRTKRALKRTDAIKGKPKGSTKDISEPNISSQRIEEIERSLKQQERNHTNTFAFKSLLNFLHLRIK